jgi:hypothetical protein
MGQARLQRFAADELSLSPDAGRITIIGLDSCDKSVLVKTKVDIYPFVRLYGGWNLSSHFFHRFIRAVSLASKLLKRLNLDQIRSLEIFRRNKQKLG